MSSVGLFEKITNIQKIGDRWIYFLFVLGIVIPTIVPLGLPITVSEPTIKIYDFINSLEPGSIVVFQGGIMPLAVPELYTAMKGLLRHVFSIPGVRVYLPASGGTYGVEILIRAMSEIWGDPRNIPGKVYGEDYVILPYMRYGTSVLALNPQSIWSFDYYGTPVEQIPLYMDYSRGSDAALAIHFCIGPAFTQWVNYFYILEGTKLVMPTYGYIYTELLPYYTTEQIVGYMVGLRGGAEYEKLMGAKGESIAATDALSGTYIWILVIVLIGNVGNAIKKLSGGGER